VTFFFCFILQIKNLTNQAQRNSGAASIAVDELRQARSRLDAYNSKIGELESANASLLVCVCQDVLHMQDDYKFRRPLSLVSIFTVP
jgi:lamin B